MAKNASCALGVLSFALTLALSNSGVLELNDHFLDVKDHGIWLVKFYAPWCGHCKKLEPVWSKLGSSLELEKLGVKVARLDATRFTKVAQELGIRGYPTLQLINYEDVHSFYGERTYEDILEFAVRAKGPTVRSLPSEGHFEEAFQRHEVFFFYVTANNERENSELRISYKKVAGKFLTQSYFYFGPSTALPARFELTDLPVIVVFKDGDHTVFEAPHHNGPQTDDEGNNDALTTWVNQERFPMFPKMGHNSLYEFARTNKLLVLVAVEVMLAGYPPKRHENFRLMVKNTATLHHKKYHPTFQFGWMDGADTLDSITSSFVQLPNFIIFKPDTYNYYMSDVPVQNMTEEMLVDFFDAVMEGKGRMSGGNSILMRIYRVLWDILSTVYTMFYNQPLISSLVFGLPTAMLTFICVNICCAEPYEGPENADSEDEDGVHPPVNNKHEKND